MTTFAENNIVFPDGQLNVAPLPEAVMINGFTPETRDAPGMPLPAQYLNWLFRDIYRQAGKLEQKTNTLNDRVIPAWMPIACPMADAPAGYLKCNGAAFDKEMYPELAVGYPSGKLPDLRGEFIRGWDDGRGVNLGRAILSPESDLFLNHTHPVRRKTDNVGITQSLNINDPGPSYLSIVHSASVLPDGGSDVLVATSVGGTETRPRNIAFLYIVRAA